MAGPSMVGVGLVTPADDMAFDMAGAGFLVVPLSSSDSELPLDSSERRNRGWIHCCCHSSDNSSPSTAMKVYMVYISLSLSSETRSKTALGCFSDGNMDLTAKDTNIFYQVTKIICEYPKNTSLAFFISLAYSLPHTLVPPFGHFCA